MDNTKNTNQADRLFGEFPPVTTAEWEARIQEDLKGADYEKKLVWKTAEGFAVKPYYRSGDMEGLASFGDALPGQFPYLRGNKADGNNGAYARTLKQPIRPTPTPLPAR